MRTGYHKFVARRKSHRPQIDRSEGQLIQQLAITGRPKAQAGIQRTAGYRLAIAADRHRNDAQRVAGQLLTQLQPLVAHVPDFHHIVQAACDDKVFAAGIAAVAAAQRIATGVRIFGRCCCIGGCGPTPGTGPNALQMGGLLFVEKRELCVSGKCCVRLGSLCKFIVVANGNSVYHIIVCAKRS